MLTLFASILTGCNGGPGGLVGGYGEDSWAHFEGGGIFDGGTPSMSPDGTTLVYSSPCSGRGDVVRVNRDGTGRVKLAGSDDYEAHPIYSPDGARIAYVREHAGDRHIWSMNSDGTGKTQLTFGGVLDDIGEFSPDGSRIHFDRSQQTGGGGRFPKPYVMQSDGKSLRPRPVKPESVVKDGVASPDGKHIYFVSRPYARDLCVRDADGARERILPAPDGYKTVPRFSPDGRTLLIGVLTKGQRMTHIALIDVTREEVAGVLRDDCGAE